MQSINVVVLRSWFLRAFFATAVLCLVAIVAALVRWQEPGSAYLLVGGALYLAGTFTVTILCNVPRNRALASIQPGDPGGATVWADYLVGWTAWNHVRTVASLAAAALFSIALAQDRAPASSTRVAVLPCAPEAHAARLEPASTPPRPAEFRTDRRQTEMAGPSAIQISRVDHIGIRVTDLDRAMRFYGVLGFEVRWKDPHDAVAVIKNRHDVELNLVFNANADAGKKNILMDVGEKYPGYTHVALRVESVKNTIAALREHDIRITQGPVSFGRDGHVSVFVRDPDLNVIELRGREEDLSALGGVADYKPEN